MSLRIPIPTQETAKPLAEPVRSGSREFGVRRGGALHDAGLHHEMLGADDKRLWWVKPSGPIRVPAR